MEDAQIKQLNINILDLRTRLSDLGNNLKELNYRYEHMEGIIERVFEELKTLNENKTINAYQSLKIESWMQKASKKIGLPNYPQP